MTVTEDTVEQAAIEWFEELGYAYLAGPSIAPGEPGADRDSYGDVVLQSWLTAAIDRLNPEIPAAARDEALRKVLLVEGPSLTQANGLFHRMLVAGVGVAYRRPDGTIKYDHVHLVDFDNPDNNDWHVVNQFTVTEGTHTRRADIVVFLNGLPIAVMELKNAAQEQAEAKSSVVAKIIMTGSAMDGPEWQPHIRNKQRRRDLANRFKDPQDPFSLVIVRDMWLTGFDAPCMHTMYADKPMRGHGLMQAIARVNRVFRDKPGGLVVDYLGLADQLKRALATYTESGGRVRRASIPRRRWRSTTRWPPTRVPSGRWAMTNFA